MLLREFFYFDDTLDDSEDLSYDPAYDESVIDSTDTRVTRLRLKDICRARKASDYHNAMAEEERTRIRDMYATPAEGAGGI